MPFTKSGRVEQVADAMRIFFKKERLGRMPFRVNHVQSELLNSAPLMSSLRHKPCLAWLPMLQSRPECLIISAHPQMANLPDIGVARKI